ncbi:MAG TPA: hypothetical protein VEH47_05770 [Candidatus Acidoferrales bacterium]|nr:hypothetical protein [Candidatus Acidoferrales bacterium]
MPSARVSALTKEDITAAAGSFRWKRQMPKWSVIVEGRELPARPLVLEAAGVPPNDPTNSHQAVAILKERGFEVRYQGKATQEEDPEEAAASEVEDLIRKLRGSLKAPGSVLEDWEREHRIEKERLPR